MMMGRGEWTRPHRLLTCTPPLADRLCLIGCSADFGPASSSRKPSPKLAKATRTCACAPFAGKLRTSCAASASSCWLRSPAAALSRCSCACESSQSASRQSAPVCMVPVKAACHHHLLSTIAMCLVSLDCTETCSGPKRRLKCERAQGHTVLAAAAAASATDSPCLLSATPACSRLHLQMLEPRG